MHQEPLSQIVAQWGVAAVVWAIAVFILCGTGTMIYHHIKLWSDDNLTNEEE